MRKYDRNISFLVMVLLICALVGLPISDSRTIEKAGSAGGSPAARGQSSQVQTPTAAPTAEISPNGTESDHLNLENLKLANSSAYYHERQRLNPANQDNHSIAGSLEEQKVQARERIKAKLLAVLSSKSPPPNP